MRKREMLWKLFNPKALVEAQRQLNRDVVNPWVAATTATMKRTHELQSRLLDRCEEAVGESSEFGATVIRTCNEVNSAVNNYMQQQVKKFKQ